MKVNDCVYVSQHSIGIIDHIVEETIPGLERPDPRYFFREVIINEDGVQYGAADMVSHPGYPKPLINKDLSLFLKAQRIESRQSSKLNCSFQSIHKNNRVLESRLRSVLL
jgi:hypothetical protein